MVMEEVQTLRTLEDSDFLALPLASLSDAKDSNELDEFEFEFDFENANANVFPKEILLRNGTHLPWATDEARMSLVQLHLSYKHNSCIDAIVPGSDPDPVLETHFAVEKHRFGMFSSIKPEITCLYRDTIVEDGEEEEDSEFESDKDLVMLSIPYEVQSGATLDTSASECNVSYEAARTWLMNDPQILQRHQHRVILEDSLSIIQTFRTPQLTFVNAMEERLRVFCIAASNADTDPTMVDRMLSTIYQTITKSTRPVPSIGSHWERIGYQSNDPKTDLRGCGIFSLLQFLYLVSQHVELSQRLYRISQRSEYMFPVACTLINVSHCCLQALRNRKLFVECNRQKSVLHALNNLYFSIASTIAGEFELFSFSKEKNPHAHTQWPQQLQRILEKGKHSPRQLLKMCQPLHL